MVNPNSARYPPSQPEQWSDQTPTQHSSNQQPPQHSHPSLPYQPPPQYPPAFQPRTQPSQPHQPTSSTSPLSSTSRTATTTTTSFHHYNPHPHPHSSASSTSSTSQPRGARHQITAPFQVPRMPMSWPWPTAPVNSQGQVPGQSWVDRSAQGNANANIDPSLLVERRGHGGSGWPSSSG